MKRNGHRNRQPLVNPWDKFAARLYGTGDVITNSAGDTLVLDEIVIHPGDIKGACIVAVMCYANDRMMGRWGPMLNHTWTHAKDARPHSSSRYRKWDV